MANFLSPIFNEQTFDANGDPLVGGKLYTYQAGTSTAQATYTTQDGSTQQANPIILNARGEPDNPIWLASGSEYKFILKDSNGVTLRTVDDIGGVNDISSAADQWVLYSVAPTYVSATSFTVPGDQTNTFHVGRRLKTTNTGGTIYSRISASAYGSSTTVTVVNDSGTLDSGLSAVSYGFLTATSPSLPNSSTVRQSMGFGYGADIASAATIDLTARTGNIVRITGTTGPVTALTMTNGDQVMLEIVSTPTFNVSGVLSYTCVAGDNIFVWQDGNGTQGAFVLKHFTASTTAAGEVELATDAEVTTGTDTGRVPSVSSMRNSLIVANASEATTSGTTKDKTGIPSWAKRVMINIIGVSTAGASNLLIQGGPGTTPDTSGYLSYVALQQNASSSATGGSTSGFLLCVSSAAATTLTGTVYLERVGTSDTWMASYSMGLAGSAVTSGGGSATFSGALGMVRLTSDGGSAFDAGSWSVSWA